MRALVACVMLMTIAFGADALLAATAGPPGLKLTLEAGAAKDVRLSRLLALRVPEGAPASPFLSAGPFKATWDGAIFLRIKDEYVFSAAGRGAFKLTLNDQVVLDVSGDDLSTTKSQSIKLKKGANVLHAEHTSPAAGESWVRLYWANSGLISESVSPLVLTHEPEDAALDQQNSVRLGRQVVADLRCVKCHATDVPAGAMPELLADAPSLDDVGQRYTQSWLAHWINDPQAMRSDTEMPRVFAGPAGTVDQRARDIAAYLTETSAKAQATSDAASAEQVGQGTRLFASLGCVACHLLPGQTPKPDDPVRFSLTFVKTKFQPGALKTFLLKPEAHYAWIRMPNFRLSDAEAAALSAFLRSRPADELKGETSGDAKRGQALFQSSGCINCHGGKLQSDFKAASLAEIAKADLSRGCLAKSADQRGKAPDFGLSDEQRAGIAALAKTEFAPIKSDVPAEFAERQVVQMNCTACHTRDKTDDNWSTLKDEVDALTSKLPPEPANADVSGDQSRPPLTWIGEKLRPAWMASFIAGEVKYKPRPWIAARMPGFASRAKGLALGLTEQHGCASVLPPNPPGDPQFAEIGKKLVNKTGGFACIQCHSVGDMRALAPFEAPAINFAIVTDRLTKEFYDRWTFNPQRVVPGTRMPSFAGSDGKTSLKDTLDGDARKQFDAVWNYLLAGDNITPPTH